MKKIYSTPFVNITQITFTSALLQPSVTGDNGTGSGNEDNEGDGDPDAKQRGGLDGWGDLW